MSLEFAIEPLATVWDELVANAWEHWQETEMFKRGEAFNPQYERYASYGPQYIVFTARNDGELVGNCGMYITRSMHTQKLVANEDTWFLKPEYRKGRNAIKFYQFVEDDMKQRGVEKITMTAAPYNGAGRIMEYLGYGLDKYCYSKALQTD